MKQRAPQVVTGAVVVPESLPLRDVLQEMRDAAFVGFPVVLSPEQTKAVLELCKRAGETIFERGSE